MRRETRFKLAALQDRLIGAIPLIFILGSVIALVYFVLKKSQENKLEHPSVRPETEATPAPTP